MEKQTCIDGECCSPCFGAGHPAIAQHAVVHPSYQAQYDACPGHEPGNPYTKEEDYMAWSGWRARGGWDDRNDFNCVRASHPRHHGVVY